ncbi:hypothetical protein JCM10296v2_001508 [Rhodotorula toruloides]
MLIDPPFLIPDAEDVITFIKEKTSLPLAAVFSTHHHPDHYFSANPILEAWPEASFYAAPYVCDGIDREYDDKINFAVLPGNANSPIILLGPVIGDTVDHCMFYLPREKVTITGDCMYGRTTHVWAAEIETPAFLEAWRNILDLIDGLDVQRIIPGHLESAAGLELDANADLEHNRKYLDLFATKITYAEKKPKPDEIQEAFKQAFSQCSMSGRVSGSAGEVAINAEKRPQTSNDGFFLGFLGECHGEGGKGWPENEHHKIRERTIADMESSVIGTETKLAKKQ